MTAKAAENATATPKSATSISPKERTEATVGRTGPFLTPLPPHLGSGILVIRGVQLRDQTMEIHNR
jgi:hypothetical protein